MKLLYIGTEVCSYDTLQRLIVLADEICFLDRLVLKPDLAKGPPPPTFNMDAVSLTLNGVPISHAELAQRLVARVIQEHSLIVPSHTLAAGDTLLSWCKK